MNRWPAIKIVSVSLGVGIVIVFLYGLLMPRFPRRSEQSRPMACFNNLKQHGLALTQYAQDYDGRFPWRLGRANPREAWKDLAMLFPSYNSSWESFICPSSRDRMFDPKCASGDKKNYPLEPLSRRDGREVISYAYCLDARDPHNPKPWTEEAPATVRLMADKKAGYPVGHAENPAAKANHRDDGRNILYHDWHVRWEPGMRALDPNEMDDEVGAPDAADYHAWWSDPPFYGE